MCINIHMHIHKHVEICSTLVNHVILLLAATFKHFHLTWLRVHRVICGHMCVGKCRNTYYKKYILFKILRNYGYQWKILCMVYISQLHILDLKNVSNISRGLLLQSINFFLLSVPQNDQSFVIIKLRKIFCNKML